MNALQRFEDWVAGTLEDRLGALLGGRVEPVDLARHLGEAMDDRRTLGAGRAFVPNVYRIHLAPWTFAAFAGYKLALQDELAAFLGRRARESGYHLVGRPRVEILVDPELRPERVHVESDLVEAPREPEMHVTRPIALGPAAGREPASLALTLAGRPAIPLEGPKLTVGRALDNDVILDGATVSRHHARFVARGAHWLLEDLDSTHGSFVNGHRAASCVLRAGDEVRLGSAVVRITRSARPIDAEGGDDA